jgi:cbb3-type cytochrome oxidase maturation protein
MEVVFFLIPVSIILLGAGIAGFYWAVKSKQFNDLEGPAHRILLDDRSLLRENTNKRKVQEHTDA